MELLRVCMCVSSVYLNFHFASPTFCIAQTNNRIQSSRAHNLNEP